MKRRSRIVPLAIALVLCAAIALFFCRTGARAAPESTGGAPAADRTLSPYFFVEGADPSIDKLPLKDTRVNILVSGVIADVTVRQIYENRGTRPIHARYVFPASTRAAVYALEMTVGTERIAAKIEPREQARREFDKAKQDGKSASLLEQDRPNVFTMQVANILPGDTVAVELKYTELLVPNAGMYEVVYPTVVGPRYSSKRESSATPADRFVESPYLHEGELAPSEIHLSAQLSTGVPIRDLECPSHHPSVRWVDPTRAELTLPESERLEGDRDFVVRYRLTGPEVSSGLLLYRGTNENFFLLMAQPPRAAAPDALPPREYVFVLDVSGSMNGFPLDTAKQLMGNLVGALQPSDSFDVVLFADGSNVLAPRALPASAPNLARALRFIGPQPGGGGTELLAALKRAFAIPHAPGVSRTVVLVTDGYIEAERDVFGFVREHLDEANVFAFGIGSSVNRYLIEGVAKAGQGEPFVVLRPEEASAAAERFRTYIESPVLTGVKVDFSGFDAYDIEPVKVPDLFTGRPITVFGKWRGEPVGSVTIAGTNGRDPYRATFSVGGIAPLEEHAALRYLWARARIAELSDFGSPDARPEQVEQITALGLGYNLLTPYTSFVAVHEAVRNAAGGQEVDQPLAMPLGVTDRAIGEPVTGGAEPELAWLAAILVFMLGVALVRARNLASQPGMARS